MNLLDQLKTLDPKDPGRWPLPVRGFFVLVIFLAFTGVLFYVLVWNEELIRAHFAAMHAADAERRNRHRHHHLAELLHPGHGASDTTREETE